MEITSQEARTMIESRLQEYPKMKSVAVGEYFEETLIQILDFENIDHVFLSAIKNEILVILTLYAPLQNLAQNIQETTGLPIETSESVAGLIEILILQPVHNDLLAYNYLWEDELRKTSNIPKGSNDVREELELRPEGVSTWGTGQEENASGPKPLTREEVMRALAPKRTMASDIELIKKDNSGGTAQQ